MSDENKDQMENIEPTKIEIVEEIKIAEEIKPEEKAEVKPKKASKKAAEEKKTEEKPEEKLEIEAPREVPATIEIKTREGYKITGRKPNFGDRRWVFAQPEGMTLPASEVMPAAAILSIVKIEKNAKGEEVEKTVDLDQQSHPWFLFEEMGIEGPMVYMQLWNRTYMPTNGDLAQGILLAVSEMNKGNA